MKRHLWKTKIILCLAGMAFGFTLPNFSSAAPVLNHVGTYAISRPGTGLVFSGSSLGAISNRFIVLGDEGVSFAVIVDMELNPPAIIKAFPDSPSSTSPHTAMDIQTSGTQVYIMWGMERMITPQGVKTGGLLRAYGFDPDNSNNISYSQYAVDGGEFLVQDGEVIISRGLPVPLDPVSLYPLSDEWGSYSPPQTFYTGLRNMVLDNGRIWGWVGSNPPWISFYSHAAPNENDFLCQVLFPPMSLSEGAILRLPPNYALFTRSSGVGGKALLYQMPDPCDSQTWTQALEYPIMRYVSFVSESFLYTWDPATLSVFDVADPLNPALIDEWAVNDGSSQLTLYIDDVEAIGPRVFILHDVPSPSGFGTEQRLTVLEVGEPPDQGNAWLAH